MSHKFCSKFDYLYHLSFIMKKFLFSSLLAFSFVVNAQTNQPRICGTPVLPQQYETWVQQLATSNPGKYGGGATQSVFYIPVIVHVIHNNETLNSNTATFGGNLSALQVQDQINILNKDYNGTNTDTNLIPAVFKPLLGKFKVNFCLAVVNPTGGILAEPGIDRINRTTMGWTAPPYSQTYIDATIKPASIWNTSKYLNIWVSGLSGGLLGYATFPSPGTSGLGGLTGSFGSTNSDGVVILNTSFGSIGTAATGQYNKGRTATHEIGHWMGLRHIWGDGTCATDYCNDTPPAQTANYNCPAFPYKVGTCSGNTTGEMTMNYMDYTNDACMYMFTADQKNRAQLILTNSPMRAALITSTVCNLPTVGNDVGLSFVSQPTYSQTLVCNNSITPVVSITNYGSTTLTSAILTYYVDGQNGQVQTWNGSAAPNTTFNFTLNAITNLGFGAHVFSVNISSPNGGSDNNLSNNNNTQNFSIINNLIVTAFSATTCVGTPVQLSASGAASYSWSNGSTGQSISVSPSLTTVYTVTGTTGACVVPKTLTVTVVTTPSISINKTSVCEGVPTTITAGGANNYTWDDGETTASINVTLFTTSTFTVTGSSGVGCTATQAFTVVVDPNPVLSMSSTYVGCASCTNATVTSYPSGGTQPYTYIWTPGGATTASAPNVGIGCYTVTVSDSKGCKAVDSVCVSFDTGLLNYLENQLQVKLSPNPNIGQFELNVPAAGLKTIEIFDVSGRLIERISSSNDLIQLDLSTSAAGMYYINVRSDKGYSHIKMLKE